jgi:hypothetical protein
LLTFFGLWKFEKYLKILILKLESEVKELAEKYNWLILRINCERTSWASGKIKTKDQIRYECFAKNVRTIFTL